MNLLQYESSPYLLQHADNPVDWRPWSEAAFEAARSENKPIFLSIGYSTCHWCHVMARECFEDVAVAEVLNEHYISIKVDREERPDVDAVYMAAAVAMNGSGGWPLNVLLTPEKKPFYAASYLPKEQLLHLLGQLAALWKEDPGKILTVGELITEQLGKEDEVLAAEPRRALVYEGMSQLKRHYDPAWGGFSRAPKFPTPQHLLFALRFSALTGDASARDMALGTLEHMIRGGIHDQIGGGFCRYSTDEKWLIPHFEKTLYDNALLLLSCAEAWAMTGRGALRRVCETTLRYLNRELSDPAGGFYCGQDADSDGAEGEYYLFSPAEIAALLGGEAESFCRQYGITAEGNFRGQSIPNRIEDAYWEYPSAAAEEQRKIVEEYRLSRPRPLTDDKILTGWNGLAVAALARYGFLSQDRAALERAEKAAGFLLDNLVDPDGHLLARWRRGDAGIRAKLDDHAFFVWGLLELYAATLDVRWLREACRIADALLRGFFNDREGGFYPYAHDDEALLLRSRDAYDGAIPSGNAVAALVLTRLDRLTGESRWHEAAEKQLRFLSGAAERYPMGYSFSLLAMSESIWPGSELVCTAQETPQELWEYLLQQPDPNRVVLLKKPETASVLAEVAPYTADYPIPESGAKYYLCRDHICRQPVGSPAEL